MIYLVVFFVGLGFGAFVLLHFTKAEASFPITEAPDEPSIVVIGFVKDGHHYSFIFNEGREDELKRILCRFAADAELNLNWNDLPLLMEKVVNP